MDSIIDRLAQSTLRWFGRVSRMKSDNVVRKVWENDREVTLGRDRPEQTWDGVVKKDMKKRSLLEEWAQDRDEWRTAIHIPTLVKQGDR